MGLVLLPIIAGFLFSTRLQTWTDRLISWGLYLLLVAMGLNIGLDPQIKGAIPVVGMQALVLCLISSLLSILAVVLYEKMFLIPKFGRVQRIRRSGLKKELYFIITVLICISAGLAAGNFIPAIPQRLADIFFTAALLVICTGIGSSMRQGLAQLLQIRGKLWLYALVPLCITVGSVLGGLLGGMILGINLVNSTAISGTMAFYSLGSVVITSQAGVNAGLTAFLSNLLRELLTFFAAPFLARYSYLAPLALGGASTMDTTLPVMKQCLPEEYTIMALYNGIVLSLVIPLLLAGLYSFS